MTIHLQPAISNTKTKTRWLEPFVSESINRMFFAMGEGIQHGFRLTPDGGSVVRLSHDPTFGDSMVVVHDDAKRFALVYREDVEQTLDLGSGGISPGDRVWIFVHIDYTVGVATSAEIRVVDAAELANPWVLEATLLGTVRVPSAGAITAGDIDHGSASFLGLTKGARSRWTTLNSNAFWEKGFAGWTLGGTNPAFAILSTTGAEVYSGTRALRLGDISGSGGTVDTTVSLRLPPLLEDDIVLWRAKINSSGVSNGGFLQVDLGAHYSEVVLDSTNPGFEDHGYAIAITADSPAEDLVITCDLNAGATATGRFSIDKMEVWLYRPTADGVPNSSPHDGAFREIRLGDSEVVAEIGLRQAGGGGEGLVGFDGNNASLAFTDTGDGTAIAASVPSLTSAANAGVRASQAQDVIWPKAVFSGGVVSDGGGSTVDVTALTVRAADAAISGNTSDRYFDLPPQSGSALPVTGGVQEFYVVWDPNTLGINSFLVGSIGAGNNPETVILAYVRYDGAAIDKIVDMRDLLTDLERSVPITVGDSDPNSRFGSLEGALRMLSVTGFTRPKEVVITGDLTFNGAVDNEVPVPSNTTIRGAGKPLIATVNLATNLFDLSGVTGVEFRDLRFLQTVGTAGTVFGANTSDPVSVAIRNVDALDNGGSRWVRVVDFIAFAPTDSLLIEGCHFEATTTCVEVDQAGATDLSVRVLNSEFGGDIVNHGGSLNIDVNSSSNNAMILVAGCKVLESASGGLILEGRQAVSDCFVKALARFSGAGGGETNGISNCIFDYSANTVVAGEIVRFDSWDGTITGIRILGRTATNAAWLIVNTPPDEIALSGISITHGLGTALILRGCTGGSLAGFTLKSDGTGSTGLQMDLSTVRVQAGQGSIEGYPDNLSVKFDGAGTTNNQVGNVIIDEPTPGLGFSQTGGAAGNVTNNLHII